jgi:hypothetical protein
VADAIVSASALVDALGPEGKNVEAMAELARSLQEATVRR